MTHDFLCASLRAGGAAAALLVWGGMAAATPVPVTVRITSVECTQDDECDAAGIEAAGESWPDFYAKIFINGIITQTPRQPDDRKRVEPTDWVATVTVDDAAGPTVPITIQIWDHDSTSGDDLGDASPQPDHDNLDLVLDLASGAWSGDTTTACATGDGVDTDDREYYPLTVCFDITAGFDQDGDGLMDAWETSGFDADGDGVVDIDLPAMGADPLRKDIFLELDYQATRAPSRDGIAALKRAFAVAPVPNPGGRANGINLHVDVGRLVDPRADEAGRAGTCLNGIDDDGDGTVDGADSSCRYVETNREVGAPDCNNGIDDDGDGLADGADPNCLVGDDFGGGQAIAAAGICQLNPAFATAKAANFDPRRARIFHYAIQSAAAAACVGGQGELGGNDFVSHNLDPGTLMHELGHNLGLEHGGNETTNCKPNYVSVMNYNLQAGIPRVGRGFILDYSPPRRALDGSTRSTAPLAPLGEASLDETAPIDAADGANQTLFLDGLGRIVTVPLTALPNYNGDADPPVEALTSANLNNALLGPPPVGQRGCANSPAGEVLTGADDWSRLKLTFRDDADSADGVVAPPPPEDHPTDVEIEAIIAATETTDLAAGLADAPDPVAAGTAIDYLATLTNEGPNPTGAAWATLTLPPETTLAGALPAGCVATAPSTVACAFGAVPAGESRTASVSASVPADLVHKAGAPVPVTATLVVEDKAGTDPDPADNTVAASTTVVAVADLALRDLAVANPPARMLVGEPVVVSLDSVIDSAGPSSPMDTLLTLTAKADAGATVSPTWLVTRQPALAIAEARPVVDHAILTCRSRGLHVWEFGHRIDPARTPDSDPDDGNNSASAKLEVECLGADEVEVNLQPGAFPNRVRPGTREANLAVLTTAAGEYGLAQAFDATTILPETVTIGTRRMLAGLEPGTRRWGDAVADDSVETTLPEVTRDGDRDLTFFTFDVDDAGIRIGDTEVCIRGMHVDAGSGETREFSGCDAAVVSD